MLSELRVENLLLIDRAELMLAPGLNVITGETGAGKTVLTGALDLLMGGKPRTGIVRPGAEEAYVEGVFCLPDGLSEELESCLPESVRDGGDLDGLTLARRVGADGRTRAYLNGRSAAIADLRELGARLVSFYGQHEHRKLVLAGAQLQLLDDACGVDHLERLDACAGSYARVRRLELELERLEELGRTRERELELVEHELAEIAALAPDEQEHRALLTGRERLRRLEALRAGAGGAADALAGEAGEDVGAGHLLAGAAARLHALSGVDAELDALAERCEALSIEAHDLAGELSRYCEGIDAEEGSLEAVEERIAALESVTRKHGGTIASTLEYAEHARARRDELCGFSTAHRDVEARLAAERSTLDGHVRQLRAERRGAAELLGERVREQLSALAMAGAKFEIVLAEAPPKANGADAAEFMIAPNPGMALAPLRETASGGELSRVMLALTSASEGDRAGGPGRARPTLVFDEVDAGIGGHTARAVGERLQSLARARQVVCVTHLPQIASLADRHFSIAKDVSAEPAVASVAQLSEQDVVAELVRMLGAQDEDAAARKHARELRRAA